MDETFGRDSAAPPTPSSWPASRQTGWARATPSCAHRPHGLSRRDDGPGKRRHPRAYPGYAGTYIGALANETARKTVEDADLLLCLGAWMTDLDLGGYTARLDPNRMIVANSERVKVSHHIYEHVPIKNFLDGLLRDSVPKRAGGGRARRVRRGGAGAPPYTSPRPTRG